LIVPQPEQSFDDGKNRSTITRREPYHSLL